MEDYKKKYLETLEQLFLTQGELNKEVNEKEYTYLILNTQSFVINQYWENLNNVTGERKVKLEDAMQKLILVFNHMGRLYLNELKWRKDLFAANKSLLEASAKIESLEKEIERLNKMNEF